MIVVALGFRLIAYHGALYSSWVAVVHWHAKHYWVALSCWLARKNGVLTSSGSFLLLEVMSIPDKLRKLGFIDKFGPLTLARVLGTYWHAKY